MRSRRHALVAVLAALLAAAPALARAEEPPAEVDAEARGEPVDAAEAEPKPTGGYGGAHADGSGPAVRHRPGRNPEVGWVGFQSREGGGARLFVQLDRDVEADQTVEGNRLIVTLPGVVARNRNTVRALDTRFFDSTVARVEPAIVRRGKRGPAGLRIAIAFKGDGAPAAGQLSSSRGKDGLTYLAIDFPSAPAATGPVAAPPAE